MLEKMEINKNWKLNGTFGKAINAQVPGDISYDLYCAKVITNPYFGMNHLAHGWIIKSDFEYETQFDIDDEILKCEEVILEFEGIDTFSEIYFNGEFLGKTDNMFLAYRYNIKKQAKKNGNTLTVKMLSTKNVMDKIDTNGYFGTFNIPRIFIRKAQCHFGWDWAPNMPAYGIYKPVNLYGASKHRIDDITYKAHNDGNLTIVAELNYTVRSVIDYYGGIVDEADEGVKNDVLRYTLSTKPNADFENGNSVVKEMKVTGAKNFINFKLENPELWWPAGYGEQPLYSYKVELVRDGEIVDCRVGRLAFRNVVLSQKPISDTYLEFKFIINGTPVFIKGSNWVPAECFTGTVKKEKYEKLISLARDANFNMLRIWGGGIYENDAFYDICDELGILVWQDMMFACSDIPEEIPEFVENCKKEINYQIKRLRNHPSIIYWCGGNEKTGCLAVQNSRGDYFVDVILRGLITNLDDTRPYARQSPYSITDVDNDITSGDSHVSAFETCLERGVDKYRETVAERVVPFVSECANMGPGSLASIKKMFPEDKLWPMNEYWDDRLMDNPYAAVPMPFAKVQKLYADGLYGETTGIEDFVAKGMTSHAEILRTEIEYARYYEGQTSGIMNWMYSDIWPSGTWSVVDYFCEPKHAYYQMKKSFAPLLLTFVYNNEQKLVLTLVNDELGAVDADIEYGLKALNGEILWTSAVSASLKSREKLSVEIDREFRLQNTYLYAKSTVNGKKISTVFSYDMWSNCKFESDYTFECNLNGDGIDVTVKANKFAKGVSVCLPDSYKYTYTDNYFDLEAGEKKTISILGATEAQLKEIWITDFAKETQNG